MYFHICKKNLIRFSNPQIILLLVSFESYIKKVIFIFNFIKFHPCVLQLEIDFFDNSGPFRSMGKWHFQNFVKV